MATDPTMDLVRSLGDESQWVVIRNVPVEKPHKRDAFEVTEADLYKHAEAVNRVYVEDGVPVRVTVGHVLLDPKAPETSQPPLVGFAKDAKVGRYGPQHKPAVLVDLYIRPDQASVLRKYPFRSMEIDPGTGRIHGVALLLRDPWLDMGAIHYSAGRWLVTYEGSGMADEKDDDFTEDEKKQYARCAKYLKKHYAKLAAYMDDMGAGNANTPEPIGYQKPPAVDPTVKALQDQLAALGRARVEETSRRLLDPLVTVVKFDYARELGALVAYPTDEERAKHAQYILGHYEKLPTAGGFLPTLQGPAPGVTPSTAYDPTAVPQNHERVMAYMRSKPGLTYEAAKAAVQAGQA